jgi:peptidoglycan/xylan/chitin deacetylase (PgdA/CDA1 family)
MSSEREGGSSAGSSETPRAHEELADELVHASAEEFREFLEGDAHPVDEIFRERLLHRLRSLFAIENLKRGLASSFDATGLNAALLRAQNGLLWPYARALNYHDVPARFAGMFESQLRFYAKHFVSVGPFELRELHSGGWRHPKPGLLLTFDDGFRSHADVVAPLLEKYGFTGWFNVPIGFVETPPAEQRAFARANRLDPCASGVPDDRIALSWDDLLRLDGRHEICCHTWNHRRLSASLSPQELEHEIVDSKRRLEEGLGHEVRGFTWVGGEEWAYSRAAADVIRAAGYEVAFMTNNAVIRPHDELQQIQRTNVEASFDPRFVRFCLTGFYDALYTAKRRRVNRLTAQRAA